MPHCGVEERDDHAAVDHALDVLVRLGHGQLAPHHAALDLVLAKAERLDESSMARSGHRPRASPEGGTSRFRAPVPFPDLIHCYTPRMSTLRRLLPFALIPLGLLSVLMMLGRGSPVFADEKPGTPPGGTEPGMADPAMGEPGMGEPGMGEPGMDEAKDPDDEDDVPEALIPRVEKAIKKGVAWLKSHQLADGSWGVISGGSTYGGGKGGGYDGEVPGVTFAPPPGGNEDLSSTQLAALALLACERCQIKTDSKVWNDIVNFSLKQQQDDGPEWDRVIYTKDNAPKAAASP